MPTTTDRPNDRGFAMVALLVGMAVAAVYMTMALPAWRQQMQREREEELIYRGEQYARAIVLFMDKNRGALPSDLDLLVSQHYLRKKWKDPITNDDFALVGTGIATTPGQTGVAQPGQTQPGRGTMPGGAPGVASPMSQQPGISGVRSKSNATSIKIYQNQQQYSLWQFDAQLYRARMGRNIPQQQQPGRQGGEPGQPGRGAPQIGVPGGVPGRPGGGQPGAPPPPTPVGPRGGAGGS